MALLPAVVLTLNNKVTHLTGNKPSAAIKVRKVAPRSFSVIAGHPVGLKDKTSPPVLAFIISATLVAGPVWSLSMFRLGRSVTKP